MNSNQPMVLARGGRQRRAAGSAYIITLLALFVLTAVGLTLVAITQTEVQIGGNERIAGRLLYAADGGIGIMAPRLFVQRNYYPMTLTLPDAAAGLGASTLRTDIRAFAGVVGSYPCSLCQINNRGEYGNRGYRRVNHTVTSTAERLSAQAVKEDPFAKYTVGDDRALASAHLTSLLDLLPVRDDPSIFGIEDRYESARSELTF